MWVICEKCRASHQLAHITVRNEHFLCSCCGYKSLFLPGSTPLYSSVTNPKINPKKISTSEEPPKKRWQILRSDGTRITLQGLGSLQEWILEGTLQEKDQISRVGQQWKSLGEIEELAPFFAEAKRRVPPKTPSDERTTLPFPITKVSPKTPKPEKITLPFPTLLPPPLPKTRSQASLLAKHQKVKTSTQKNGGNATLSDVSQRPVLLSQPATPLSVQSSSPSGPFFHVKEELGPHLVSTPRFPYAVPQTLNSEPEHTSEKLLSVVANALAQKDAIPHSGAIPEIKHAFEETLEEETSLEILQETLLEEESTEISESDAANTFDETFGETFLQQTTSPQHTSKNGSAKSSAANIVSPLFLESTQEEETERNKPPALSANFETPELVPNEFHLPKHSPISYGPPETFPNIKVDENLSSVPAPYEPSTLPPYSAHNIRALTDLPIPKDENFIQEVSRQQPTQKTPQQTIEQDRQKTDKIKQAPQVETSWWADASSETLLSTELVEDTTTIKENKRETEGSDNAKPIKVASITRPIRRKKKQQTMLPLRVVLLGGLFCVVLLLLFVTFFQERPAADTTQNHVVSVKELTRQEDFLQKGHKALLQDNDEAIENARTHFERALGISEHPRALAGLILAYTIRASHWLDDAQQESRLLSQTFQGAENSLEATEIRVRLDLFQQEASRELRRANEYVERALTLAPKNRNVLAAVAEYQIILRNREGFLQTASRLKKLHKNIWESDYLSGLFAFGEVAQGKVGEKRFAEALQKKPDLLRARYRLALYLESENRLEEAKEQAKEILRHNPKHARATVLLDRLSHALKHPEQNKKSSLLGTPFLEKTALETSAEEKTVQDWIRAGNRFSKSGKLDQALSAYLAALEQQENSLPALLGAASIYLRKNRPDYACSKYRSALKISPNHPAVLFGLGECHFEMKNKKEAIKRYQDYLRVASHGPLISHTKKRLEQLGFSTKSKENTNTFAKEDSKPFPLSNPSLNPPSGTLP